MQTKKVLNKSWLKKGFWFFSILILCQIAYIIIDGLNDYTGKADVAIVLGNRVYADKTLSSWLKGRVDKALALYKQGRVKKIFVSGGVSLQEEGGQREGDAMKLYLIEKGVPGIDIIADNSGQNTNLTAKDFMEWNKKYNYSSAIIVSQFYHITRSKYILRKRGFKNVFSASSDVYSFSDIVGTLREVPAFYKYLLWY